MKFKIMLGSLSAVFAIAVACTPKLSAQANQSGTSGDKKVILRCQPQQIKSIGTPNQYDEPKKNQYYLYADPAGLPHPLRFSKGGTP